jgi:hypothetical protein
LSFGPRQPWGRWRLALNVPDRTWTVLDPIPADRYGQEFMAAVWAGSRLFLWGGLHDDGEYQKPVATGWTWRP